MEISKRIRTEHTITLNRDDLEEAIKQYINNEASIDLDNADDVRFSGPAISGGISFRNVVVVEGTIEESE